MNDNYIENKKLERSRVVVSYVVSSAAKDGSRTEKTFTTSTIPAVSPELPLLEALEELSRLTALFGFGDEALVRFERARARVAEALKTLE